MTGFLLIFIEVVFCTKRVALDYVFDYLQSPYTQDYIQRYYDRLNSVEYERQYQTYPHSSHIGSKSNSRRRHRGKGFGDLDESSCSCDECNEPRDCCVDTCNKCPRQLDQTSQSFIIVVPFPYPFLLQMNDISTTPTMPIKTITSSMTTTLTTTNMPTEITKLTSKTDGKEDSKEETPGYVTDNDYKSPNNTEENKTDEENDKTNSKTGNETETTPASITSATKSRSTSTMAYTIPENRHRDLLLQDISYCQANKGAKCKSLLLSMRRTKPIMIPKYGFIPIPNDLAVKLLLQLRQIDGLRKEDLRNP